jgi:hypothetical protein
MRIYTLDEIRTLKPCYADEKLAGLVGGGVTASAAWAAAHAYSAAYAAAHAAATNYAAHAAHAVRDEERRLQIAELVTALEPA